MKDNQSNIESLEQETLGSNITELSSVEEIRAEIRRKLLVLVEHPMISDSFRNDPIIQEMIK